RAGQQNYKLSVLIHLDPRGGTIWIRQDGGALWNQCLSFVIGGHLISAAGESLADLLQNVVIQQKLSGGHPGEDLAGDVVLGRAKPASGDDGIRASQRVLDRLLEPRFIVPNNGLRFDLDPD